VQSSDRNSASDAGPGGPERPSGHRAASPRGSTNLRSDLDALVGRSRELQELKALLGRTRLVTLSGPGGVGKSRLARELATRLAPAFTGGIWMVELAELAVPARLVPTVARQLGVHEQRSERLEVQIAQSLRGNTLLILDNCEHLVDACAELVGTLLREAPLLRIVATSRTPLEIDGERVFEVPALALPRDASRLQPGDWRKHPAVRLFVERRQARDPHFQVTAENVGAIASICKGFGGMPLAIELGASRLASTPLDELKEHLDEQLDFENLRRDAPSRHRSMRATLAWSLGQLTEPEQELWRRFWVFAGGATFEAVERVCGFGALEGPPLREALQGLVENSILRLDSDPRQARYHMLEPLRVFGHECSRDAGTEPAIRRRHLAWCREVIPTGAWIDGARQLEAMTAFEQEYANLTAALDTCLRDRWEVGEAIELFIQSFLFFGLRGWYRDERHFAEALLALSHGGPGRSAHLHFAAGFAAWYTYDLVPAKLRFDQALQESDGEERSIGLALFGLGICALAEERYPEAIETLGQACRRLADTESWTFLANARYQLAEAVLIESGDVDAADAILEPNLRLVERGDEWNAGMTYSQRGLNAWRRGQLDEAEERLRSAIERQTKLGHLFGLASSLDALAWVAVSRRDFARGARLLGAADRLYDRLGTSLFAGLLPDRRRAIDRARTALGERRFKTYRESGAKMRLAEAIAYASRQNADAPENGGQSTELTARESQIAEMVSAGATNRQIAFELLISIETVKTHVRSILKKLGFESRVQIAAWVGEAHDRRPTRGPGSGLVDDE
jgi:non-specific serine/threonine protein kinase